jgi:hypothetical protein
MFPTLRPFFKTAFKILKKNASIFFTDELCLEGPRNGFLSAPSEIWEQQEVSWSQVRRLWHMILGGDAFSC